MPCGLLARGWLLSAHTGPRTAAGWVRRAARRERWTAMSQKWFHGVYKDTLAGENITQVASLYGGYDSPGPVIAYPPNEAFFRRRPPTALEVGDWFYIPWHPDLLRKLIATAEYAKVEAVAHANKLIDGQMKDEKEFQPTLHVVDAVGWLATLGVSAGGLAVQGAKVAAAPAYTLEAEKVAQEASKHVWKWFVGERVMTGAHIAAHAIHSPTKPQKDFSYYARHIFGVVTPSWWASLMVQQLPADDNVLWYGPLALKKDPAARASQLRHADRNWEVFDYGPKIISYHNALWVKARAEEKIKELDATIAAMRGQLRMPFYLHKVCL
jgi:hypothetical protein